MRFTLYGYGKHFLLKGFSEQLNLSRTASWPPAFLARSRSPPSFRQSLTMHSRRNGETDKVELFSTARTSGDGMGPPAEKRRVGNKLVDEVKLSAIPGAICDEDSEAESFKGGRSEEVDLETRSRAFAWCRDFLSGSWKTLGEDDFQISIVR